MNITFWNVGRKQLDTELTKLLDATRTDVLVLAEYPAEEMALVRAAHKSNVNILAVPKIACERISIFAKPNYSTVRHLRETNYYTIKELRLPGCIPVLLVLVHLPSKLFSTDVDQLQEAIFFKRDIESTETDVGHSNTLVIGDFNMNPFDHGMVSASALHSIPCLKTAKGKSRIINGRKHSFFYNPSWNLFGDRLGPPGTYFYRAPSHTSYYWNMLDQVVMRPSFADQFDRRSLTIVTRAGDVDLIDRNGRPYVSDHLPIFFKIELEEKMNREESMA